jgi:hypothetical protein
MISVKTNRFKEDKRETQKNSITDFRNVEGTESCRKWLPEMSDEA